jgi:hypothetical protein
MSDEDKSIFEEIKLIDDELGSFSKFTVSDSAEKELSGQDIHAFGIKMIEL